MTVEIGKIVPAERPAPHSPCRRQRSAGHRSPDASPSPGCALCSPQRPAMARPPAQSARARPAARGAGGPARSCHRPRESARPRPYVPAPAQDRPDSQGWRRPPGRQILAGTTGTRTPAGRWNSLVRRPQGAAGQGSAPRRAPASTVRQAPVHRMPWGPQQTTNPPQTPPPSPVELAPHGCLSPLGSFSHRACGVSRRKLPRIRRFST